MNTVMDRLYLELANVVHPGTKSSRELALENRISSLLATLQKHAVVSHHRMAEGGGTVPSGFSCEICEVECGGKLSELRHKSDCPLFPLNHQQ